MTNRAIEAIAMSEEQREGSKEHSEVKPKGLARIPNRDRGSSEKPPFIMIGFFILFAILSVIFARLS